MQIAEKIYTERKRLGWSQEQLAEQMEVSRQAVSKWESGQSMPDLDKLVLMSQIFGVSTDYLLKDEPESYTEPSDDFSILPEKDIINRKTVSTEQIQEYQSACFQTAKKIAVGVCLCIIGVILYLITEEYLNFIAATNISSAMATIALLLCVAPAAALFISTGMKMERFHYLKTESLQLTDTSLRQLKEEYERYSHTFMIRITSGVVLCIIAVITYMASEIIAKHMQEFTPIRIIPTILLLSIVTIAVYLFVSTGIRKEYYDVLLQKKEYTQQRKNHKKGDFLDVVAAIYWCVVTAGFLGYSLATNDWGRSWIVWPVAGCLFGALSVLLEFIQHHRSK